MFKMTLHIHKRWLPWLVAVVGSVVTCIVWFVFSHSLFSDLDFLHRTQSSLSWLVLVMGLLVTLLLTALVRTAQVAGQRTVILNQTNEDLQKEISDRIQAEKTKQKLEIALLQGQKLQAMGTLAGGIAHDFNNILYAIIGYIEMAREDVSRENVTYKNLGKVLEAAHRGQELVSRILAFSRRQHHQFTPIHLQSTMEAALMMLRPTIPASVMLHFEPIDVTVLGNPTQIHQVLVNLINNAVDAMEGEGKITIRMSHVLADDPFLKQFPDIQVQNYCKIEISDTGHGMDQATMERIFEPFFTTKEVGKGTGLGLSIVHSIIKEHHGEIMVTSKLGEGTKFIVILPEHSVYSGPRKTI